MTKKRPPKPVIGWEVRHATAERTDPKQWHQALLLAIREKRLIEFTLAQDVLPRRAEPHLYGVSSGVPRVLLYQLLADSERDRWQLIDVSQIVQLEVLELTFKGKRPLPAEYDPDKQPAKPK